MISVRLDAQLETQLQIAARLEGTSKSELIRRCLESYVARQKATRSPAELGRHLFGKHGSGRSDLSRNRKQILRAKLHAKANRG